MTTEHTPNGLIGASPKRVEDPPLITGKGCYVDDINLTGMLHLAFQRSPYPHAKIISIDTSNAKAMPGVEAVITGNDLSEKLNLAPSQVLPNMKIPPHPVLARGAVAASRQNAAIVLSEPSSWRCWPFLWFIFCGSVHQRRMAHRGKVAQRELM